MKSRLLLIAISCLNIVLTNAQGTGNDVQQKEYYDFFNSIDQPRGHKNFMLRGEPERFSFSKGDNENDIKLLDTFFVKSDSSFLKGQAVKAAGFIWGPGMIKGAKVIDRITIDDLFINGIDEGWDKFYKMYDREGYWVYSVPLFSKDRTICVVKYSNHCGGLCGAGYIYYYKKIEGKWKEVYHYMTWIS